MSLTKQEFSNYIKRFNFREMFNDMGWNNDKTKQPIVVDSLTFSLEAVGEKSGFKILLCNPQADGLIPDYNTRKKIETKVTKLFQEHLIIFFDTKKSEQVWQLVVRQSGKPTKVTETRWHVNQDPELLYQRAAGIFFELDEEDHITIIDVTKRIADNFHQNNEKVTKQFYDKFKKEHTSFLAFIKGIDEQSNQEWYASLMLNRLMFCYFIQKKGFLDKNKNYLRDKLNACNEKKGKVKFYSFYRDFLLVLFHKGLNEPLQNQDVKIEIGKIPYLNGGLFDEHELEKSNSNIEIDDKAFERLFDFFDQYEWHLDTRTAATGKDINPDVIGYIFEKYINDRANMGAYYTKEDITDYISKNCILPYLFDETKRQYAKVFAADAELWTMVKTSGNAYIYDAVKKGVEFTLPEEIAQGINEVSKRTEWNKPATTNYALPTEIWREVVDRRNRYNEVKTKIDNGEITAINDFITYNLNIRQFAQDSIENTNDPEFLKHFYKALNSITIIDPTCGSGAFLFAAMNILEPLYESCLMRMRGFVEDEDRENATNNKTFGHKYKFFRDKLNEVQNDQHPNLQYFIYKSIILRNLYGVDIMKEAVEIAKLRLFLKLVACVEVDYRKPNLGLEPLPDIDFNIRAGNTLVGFATEAELKKGLDYTFDGAIAKPIIEEKCDIVAKAFKRYKEIQLTYGEDFNEFKKAKEELNNRLKALNHELNELLHKQANIYKYVDWLKSHQPFHWFAEFYEIIQGKGGFNVVIGNPPYVEYSKVRDIYTIKSFETEKCGNLYPYVIEQAYKFLHSNGCIGFIIPLSGFCTQRMKPLVQLYKKKNGFTWVSHFGWRPATLFEGVNIPLSIVISNSHTIKSKGKIFVTEFNKWYQDKREHIANLLDYNEANELLLHDFVFPKIGNRYNSIFKKMLTIKSNIGQYVRNTNNTIFYRNTGGLYWRIMIDFEPKFILNGKISLSSTLTKLTIENEAKKNVCTALLNSNLFWLYYVAYSSFHHVNPIDLTSFPVSFENMKPEIEESLIKLSKELMTDMKFNSVLQTRIHKGGNNSQSQTFYPSLSKPIVDQIDMVLAKYFNFTDEELDNIINYDIKFRLQNESGNEN
ncbi:hypothetical protein EZJ43_05215 [Pedobacter changchengzhani]|uniref:site-specific DNA-methyltransferase (adenine-specific) n=1 Tax=Pedobacter changchengzhani TaxID=2529274 RepID=A0A4R5MME0_9SPHI|nr:DNA methyltransferase [Pedobacter changchengzhani]TDG36686.1 hypothetical protein EZJ43_05215 [Pedobacter changchengzhani]